MPVRTDWHEGEAAEVAFSGVDPFEVTKSPRMEALSLDIPTEELFGRLRSLLRREAGLDAQGVTCSIKDAPDTACAACPLNEADSDTAKGTLCAIGCEQEQVLTLMAAQRV